MTHNINSAPKFAVVGHPNKGKSSIVATLSQNDAIAIALEPGTTRAQQSYPLRVDDKILYTLVDTPGFQRPRRVLEWLEAHSVSASDRSETICAFVVQHKSDTRFIDECELLTPLIEGAGIIYVVDGSVPYSAEHEAEMTILRWTGRPSLALINTIGSDDYSDTWQAALGQFFQVVRKFDAVRAPFEQHLSLLRAFGQLEPNWEQTLQQATHFLSKQRQQRQSQAASIIALALTDMMSFQEKRSLSVDESASTSDNMLADTLKQNWYQHQREREQTLRTDIEHLYQHKRIRRQEAQLQWLSSHDLFSQDSRNHWAVSRRYLATAGFGAGAIGGVGIDALTFGASFGTGALLGGLLGAAGSYYYAGKLLLPALKIGLLNNGLKKATFGPVQDSQFAYVVLGRAVDHWWHISHRNHAGRELLDLAPSDNHWLEGLDKENRKTIQKTLDKSRKQQPLDEDLRHNFDKALQQCTVVYENWRATMS
ncbi:MAG: GTPase Era involved in 16S rRNA processing [Glaciecola sp.]|jgi:GTPase Era involved in 16S rRNA processing